jgi:ATP-binding cassette subfamily B protein
VLDKGVIVERGTHETLLSLGGVYAGLWNRQREVDAAEETLRRAKEESEAQDEAEALPEIAPDIGGSPSRP